MPDTLSAQRPDYWERALENSSASAKEREIETAYAERYGDALPSADFLLSMTETIGAMGKIILYRADNCTDKRGEVKRPGYQVFLELQELSDKDFLAQHATLSLCFEYVKNQASLYSKCRSNYNAGTWPKPLLPRDNAQIDVWPVTLSWLNLNFNNRVIVERHHDTNEYSVAFIGSTFAMAKSRHLYLAFKQAIAQLARHYATAHLAEVR